MTEGLLMKKVQITKHLYIQRTNGGGLLITDGPTHNYIQIKLRRDIALDFLNGIENLLLGENVVKKNKIKLNDYDDLAEYSNNQTRISLQQKAKLARLYDGLKGIVDKQYEFIMKNKEKLLSFFIAETGCKPSECEMVQQNKSDEIIVFFRKKNNL
jgi:hypothetical protein